MTARRISEAIFLLLAAGGCASLRGHSCNSGEQFAVHESLGFGTAKPGGVVLPAEWDDFLRSVVTPRFPQGFATMESSGQWRGTDGTIVREPSHMLILDHPDDGTSEKAVQEIIAAYRTRFQQEAVFRVRTGACISF